MDPTSFLVVSYVPFLRANPFTRIENPSKEFLENVMKELDQAPGDIRGVAWTCDENFENHCPVLIMNNAKEIFDHLVEWSEGSPSSWFDLQIQDDYDRYSISLVPKIDMSINRFKMVYKLSTGSEVSEDSKFYTIFKPLAFESHIGGNETFKKVKNRLGDQINVGFIDAENFGLGHSGINPDHIFNINSIRIIHRA